MCKSLGCYDNIWALIVPSLMFNPFNMFLVRNFVRGIPAELNESAKIDGAGEVRIAFSIYFPLCLPGSRDDRALLCDRLLEQLLQRRHAGQQ